MLTASRILGDQVGSTAPVFLAFLVAHVIAGLTAVVTGRSPRYRARAARAIMRARHATDVSLNRQDT